MKLVNLPAEKQKTLIIALINWYYSNKPQKTTIDIFLNNIFELSLEDVKLMYSLDV